MSLNHVGYFIQEARPRQWTKNLLVFAALLFAHKAGDRDATATVALAFAVFCVLSSGVYYLNDLIDLDRDRQHPLKSKRPLASGKIGRTGAGLVAAGCLVGGLACGFWLGVAFGWVCVSYVSLQLAYMLSLKHKVILDVLSIAIGFVLRAVGGACVIHVEFSHWLLLCTLFLALFLAVCKRRHELVLLGENSASHREALSHYSERLLDQMVAAVTSSTVITYALYTVAPQTVMKFGGDQLKYTVPFVVYGIFRYLYLVYRREEGGSPEGLLLGDKPLLINGVLYVVAAGALVYWR